MKYHFSFELSLSEYIKNSDKNARKKTLENFSGETAIQSTNIPSFLTKIGTKNFNIFSWVEL